MSVRKKAVGKRIGKPAKKKRYKVISPRPVSKHVHKGYVKAGTSAFFNAPAGKARKPVVKKKIYNALDLEMKRKTASQPAPSNSERLYIKFSRRKKEVS